MKRRQFMMLSGVGITMRPGFANCYQQGQQTGGASPLDEVLPDQLLLRDYRPKSLYKIPISNIIKAKFPIIDTHFHARGKTPQDIDDLIKIMDKVGVERAVVFAGTGAAFDQNHKLYSRYPKRFDLWCGLDMTGVDQPGFRAGHCQRTGTVPQGRCRRRRRSLRQGPGHRWSHGRASELAGHAPGARIDPSAPTAYPEARPAPGRPTHGSYLAEVRRLWDARQSSHVRPVLVLPASEQVQRRAHERLQLATR